MSIYSNSCLATVSLSGGSLRECAQTGGPVVLMWCVILCRTGCSLLQGCTNSGNSGKIASNSV